MTTEAMAETMVKSFEKGDYVWYKGHCWLVDWVARCEESAQLLLCNSPDESTYGPVCQFVGFSLLEKCEPPHDRDVQVGDFVKHVTWKEPRQVTRTCLIQVDDGEYLPKAYAKHEITVWPEDKVKQFLKEKNEQDGVFLAKQLARAQAALAEWQKKQLVCADDTHTSKDKQ